MTRDDHLHRFVREAGHDPALLAPLAGDASNRRYLRVGSPSPLVVMDAPPDRGEDVRPFIAMTSWLREAGLSAPEILAKDADEGFLLLEDLGDNLFARHCRTDPRDEQHLYSRAIDVLGHIHQLGAGGNMAIASYDTDVLVREGRLALDWYLTGAGTEASPDMIGEFSALISAACAPLADGKPVVVLRDYHAENLLWLPSRRGLSQVGLLDYQDALAGHPAYDLVSLLEDARRDTSDALQDAMIARYLGQSQANEDAFRQAYATLGAQRNLKIIGIFARLSLRDGKGSYPALIPRVWAHLMRDLAHPAMVDLRHFVDRHLPAPDPALIKRLSAVAEAE